MQKDADHLAASRAKDAKRKQPQRKKLKEHLLQHPRLMEACRNKKILEMREYRERLKAIKDTDNVETDTRRSQAAKEVEKKKQRKRKATKMMKENLPALPNI